MSKVMKKLLSMGLVVSLTAGLAISGTVAYLTSEDSDVNVMTLGNVKIEQLEYQRVQNDDGAYPMESIDGSNSYKLEEFEQDKPLYPAVYPTDSENWDWEEDKWVQFAQVGANGGGMSVFTEPNAVDKFVFVKNTGKSDAYVRTLIAFECGSKTVDEWSRLIGFSNHFSWDDVETIGIITVEENNYVVVELVYKGRADKGYHVNGVLPSGEVTQCNLGQVYMKSIATNEDVEALDGNANGKYDILVLSQAVQTKGFADAATALDTGFGNTTVEKATEWFGGVLAENSADTWDGTSDTSWYNETDTEFVITTAEQLAGFSKLVDEGNTFEGKTVKLGKNIDLYNLLFEPIGSYRKNTSFKGTFNGQNHTISNLSQNTWELDNGYSYDDLGLGLFGLVEDATIKNLNMDGANISGESAICGTVAACAYGDMTFENITISNANVADYQYYAGGIVGWASGDHEYINCNVDATTTVAAQWGDFDNSTGGIIGGCGGSATIYMENCDVACRIDAYNDVTSTYQWYAYRRCGMLIGNTGKTSTDENGTTVAAAPQLTVENCTVTYGDWANYTYCEFAGKSWPYVRVQAGISNSAYSNPRYGHPTDANGNEVVDDNHVHNEGEDHFIECTFDQLYGGGQGVYGTATHEGVTVIYNNK